VPDVLTVFNLPTVFSPTGVNSALRGGHHHPQARDCPFSPQFAWMISLMGDNSTWLEVRIGYGARSLFM